MQYAAEAYLFVFNNDTLSTHQLLSSSLHHSLASLLYRLMFHGEMQVPQHKVAYVSTLHQQFVHLVSKMLSHMALPNIYFRHCPLTSTVRCGPVAMTHES